MLVVTIEIHPHGDVSRKRQLAVLTIANDGHGTQQIGHYDIELRHDDGRLYQWQVTGWKRSKGAVALVGMALWKWLAD